VKGSKRRTKRPQNRWGANTKPKPAGIHLGGSLKGKSHRRKTKHALAQKNEGKVRQITDRSKRESK